MRVVVQNLFGRRADWPKRRAVLAQGLRELEPDLVAGTDGFACGLIAAEVDAPAPIGPVLFASDLDLPHR